MMYMMYDKEPDDAKYPLTAYQKDIWLEQCLYPGKPIYNLGGYVILKGEMDKDVLNQAINLLIKQHDSLRMRVIEKNGEPYLKILSEVICQVPFHDFSNRENLQADCLEWLEKEFLKPFDFNGHLCQFALLKADHSTYFWLTKFHHIIIDGFGLALMYNQVIENYNQLTAGVQDIGRITYSYTDFIAENQKYLNSSTFLRDKEFWKEKCRTIPEPLFSRNGDRDLRAGGSVTSNRIIFDIQRSLYNQMIAFSKENGCTVFHFILGVLYIYFSRVCHKDEVVIGVPLLNRGKAHYKQILGLFTNVIPLRINPGKDISFKELILTIKSELMECYRHQKFPFGEIYRTAFEHIKEKSNIFDISLSYINRDFDESYATAGDYDIISMTHQHERNALTMFIREYDLQRDIHVDLDYQIGVFEKWMPIENIITHFTYLLGEVIQSGDKSLGEMGIVPKEEQRQILYGFNNTKSDYPKKMTIQELFEEQAAKTPDHPAAVFGNNRLTYRELNARANQLANVLRDKGVRPAHIVGIMVDRSLEMVVGVLGVLKAGGAFLPLDPNYPPDRLRYMLEDSSSGILLIQSRLEDRVSYDGEVIDIEDSGIYQGEDKNPVNVNTSSDLAYVIYTSGSTGKPKGVMIEHRGIANLKTFFEKNYHVNEKDRMLQFASNSFDASVWEMFTSLLAGATLYIVPKETISHFGEFEKFVDQNGITIALLPPAYLAGMEPKNVPKLKQLFTGGSAITKGLVEKWRAKLSYRNAYGPTESTVIATTWEYPEKASGVGSVPIGVPISNTEIYILDRNNRLLPIGAAGELCIGGDGLARGYLNRPELTEEKFVANPYRDGERMYKTGDLARWLPDGNIEFLGRIDHQVKIRGFRIELGEIETQLRQDARVKEAVVIAREDGQGEKYLVAYFVSDVEVTEAELKAQILKELPEYMAPSYLMRLDRMPMTPNGKVDRKALPEPDPGTNTDGEYLAPRNETEAILVELWQQVLKTERIGIRDNFFHLGGDSIKAIQVLSRLNAYRLKLDMKDLFAHPVIEELGDYVKKVAGAAEQGIITGKAGLTPIQHWLFEQRFTDKHHFNQAVMLYRQEGFAEDLLRRVFTKLVEHHDALRMVVRGEEEGIVLFNRGLEGELYSLDVVDLMGDDNFEEVIESVSNRLQASFNLYNGPLFKAGLFKTKAGDHLFLGIHHLIVDGISWRIILQDLFNGYMQALKNEAIQFPAKTDSFHAWSLHLSAYANSWELLEEVKYWAGVETSNIQPLPKDRNCTARKYQDTEEVQVDLTVPDTEKLLKEVNHAYNTEINDILLTALGLAVREWTGEEKVLINLEGHGREAIIQDIDISRTVGWFTAQYPVILDMGGDRDLAYRIKSVKESLRQIPNKGISYGILKYLTLPEHRENLHFNLQPEISFNYLGQFDEAADHEAFGLGDALVGRSISPNMECPYAIDINSLVAKGRLVINFTYHPGEYDRATMVRITENFRKKLVQLVAHCAAAENGELTPSDFTSKIFTLDQFEQGLSHLNTGNIRDLYRLSPMQEGMLYHAMMDKKSSAYFEQAILAIEGRLDLALLEESFNRLIERYDVFRTVFVHEKIARPVQVVLKERKAHIQIEKIAHLPKEHQQTFVEVFKLQDKMRGFDLQKEMPIRLSLIQTGADSYQLIWSFHHIIMDGWCLGIILKEFFGMYAGLQRQKLPEFGKVYPYSDYIKWLAKQDYEKAASYWESYLSDYEETAALSKNNGAPLPGRYEKEELLFSVGADVKRRLEKMARQNNVTLNTVFQTIWGLLLMRYNNAEDVVFGRVVSGRPHEITGVENMVGLFINTLPVRINCDGNQSFAQVLAGLQQTALESERYSYYPLAEIQARSGLNAALIDHIVAFENYPMAEVMNGNFGVAITVREIFEQTNYDFNLVIIPGKELTVKFIYNALVHERDSMEKLKNHIQALITGVLDDPRLPVKDIPMLTSEEETELLETFNDTKMEYPKDKTITELFEEQARRTPENTAVVFEKRRLTYKMLNEKANQLAGVLRNKGLKTNDIVGIMAERSPEMMIGIMGILKAGGAYLPIDPDYPAERIDYMLADSGAAIVLTQSRLANKIGFDGDILDLEYQGLYSGDAANLIRENIPQDLAYVIYTSGSTGKPKGVEVEHASLVNLVSWHRRAYQITANDRATVVAGPAFDAAVWEIWPYLVSGAGLYIPDSKIRTSPPRLMEWLKDNLITVSFMPTPLAEALLAEEWPDPIALRLMLTGGDQLHRRPRPELPFMLVNHYGPTENTVVATWAYVGSDTPGEVLPSIGRPMDNTQIYIVNRHHQLQPVGAPGELCISGDGLARGYLNNPQLTAEKFGPNPFIPGARMYRTGDLARWLPDGNIEFLGRIDHQVKIRGFRIELGEIEEQLLQQAAVKEAVVIAREDARQDKYLIAYVVAEGEVSLNALREDLLKQLPEYMVPLYFTRLDQLPLTPNGKVDRKALPEPEGREMAGARYVAPRNDVDLRIQKVWQDILALQEIGIDDDFFMFGGNSIKAIQVVAKLALDFEIGINDIFQYRTIRKLSDTIKYSKDRLKEMMAAMNEVAATTGNPFGFDGKLRSALRDYNVKNQAYGQMDLLETIHYQHILLAGGTGYLGIHLLYQLFVNTDCLIYVPVRGKNDDEARERLWARLKFYFKLDGEMLKRLETRVHVFCGDLAKAYFGLEPERYGELAQKIDCIINSAANVKHYGHYSEFYEVNVGGNQRLIEFANTGKKKTYNFISTTSVGSGYVAGEASLAFTEYDCHLGQSSDNYYVATKLEAEKWILKSREAGLTANIFRVGNLVFDSASGVFQENIGDNAFYMLVKSLIKMECFPEIKARTINFSFIDYVARAIILLFNKKNLQNETHHIFNPRQISILSLAELLKQAGLSVHTLPVTDFMKDLYQKYENEATQSYITRILVHSNLFFEGASKTRFIICNQKTENILNALHFKWPELDHAKVKLMLDHCRKVEFI